MAETDRLVATKQVARFLREREGEILPRWEQVSEECVPAASQIPKEQWREHMPLLVRRLLTLADGLAAGGPPRQDDGGAPDAFALARLAQGLDFVQHLDELTLLRLAIMRFWRGTVEGPSSLATEILEGLLDYLIRETVRGFADARVRVLRALSRVAELGLQGGDPQEIYEQLVQVIIEEVPGADTVGLLLRERDTLHLRATVGLERERAVRAFSVKVGEGFAGTVAATGKALLWREQQIGMGVKSVELRALGLRVLFGVPTPHAGEVMGVLHVGSLGHDDFSPLAMHIFTAVSDRVGLLVARQQERSLRDRVQQELQRERAQLAAVIDALPDGLLVLGRDGEMLRCNERASVLLPHFTPEIARMPLEERLRHWPLFDQNADPVPAEKSPPRRALRGEVVHSETLRVGVAARDEIGTWLSIGAAPIRASGEVVGAVVSLTDVTAMRRLQEQQRSFLRMVSHDLRTPLGTVAMQAEMLLRREKDAECVRRGQTLMSAARRMEVMIKDLVDSARQDTGQLTLERRSIDLPVFVESVRAHLAGVFAMDRVKTVIADHLPPLDADPDRLERILVNLIGNALKYSPPDSPVIVECMPERGGVLVAVNDSGSGIDPEALPHIFERYYRAERAKGTEGLGLGLAITRMLVEAHGGEISVQSVVGKGSSFRVWLPGKPRLAEDEEEGPAPSG